MACLYGVMILFVYLFLLLLPLDLHGHLVLHLLQQLLDLVFPKELKGVVVIDSRQQHPILAD